MNMDAFRATIFDVAQDASQVASASNHYNHNDELNGYYPVCIYI